MNKTNQIQSQKEKVNYDHYLSPFVCTAIK